MYDIDSRFYKLENDRVFYELLTGKTYYEIAKDYYLYDINRFVSKVRKMYKMEGFANRRQLAFFAVANKLVKLENVKNYHNYY